LAIKGKRGPKVKSFVRTKGFIRAHRKLPQHIKDDFKRLIVEMNEGDYLPSRDIKPRKGGRKGKPKQWQARLSASHRITFEFNDGEATLLLIGEHKLFD